jgi:hypothetical protein
MSERNSVRPECLVSTQEVAGSNPAARSNFKGGLSAAVAHVLAKHKVIGSNPIDRSKFWRDGEVFNATACRAVNRQLKSDSRLQVCWCSSVWQSG